MMNNSTPIGALSRNEEQDPNTREMVENIVNEIDGGGANALPPGDPRGGGYGGGGYGGEPYPGDYGPPQDYPPQGMDYGVPHEQDFREGYGGGGYGGGYGGSGGGGYGGGRGGPQYHESRGDDGSFMKSFGGGGLTSQLTAMAKDPLLVAAIFFVLRNDTVARILESYIPYVSSPFMGLVVRALVAGVVFLFTKMFIMKD